MTGVQTCALPISLAKSLGTKLKTFVHVTGGGLVENTARVIPNGLTAVFDRGSWQLPLAVNFLASEAKLAQAEYERTWNCGVGMVAIVEPESANLTIELLAARGMKAWSAGVVNSGSQLRSSLEGAYATR